MYRIWTLNISRVQLLPPKAYPDNPSTSLCTKFVHTSTNKIRCPVNCVVVSPSPYFCSGISKTRTLNLCL